MKNLRKIMALVLAVLMVAALFAGCAPKTEAPENEPSKDEPSKEESSNGDAPAGEAQYKDTIVIGDNGEPKNLDPDTSWGAVEARVSCFIHEGLVREDADGNIVPLLATDWTVSDDGLVYTFNLKEGVKFSDGTDVKVSDWAWSLYRARDNEESNSRSVAANIATVEGSDEDHTLVITLSKTDAAFLANLCKWNMVVKSEAHFNEVGKDGFLRDPLGTGPYALVEWQQGQYIKFVANEYYHVEGKPATKNLLWKVITDDNTRLLQLQSHDIDIMGVVPTNMMSTVEADETLVANTFDGSQIRFLVFNCSDKVVGDPLVREALELAMDKQAIVDMVAGGYAVPVDTYVNTIHGDLCNTDIKVTQDIEKAKKLMADAGYANGVEITMNTAAGNAIYENIATILQAQWAQIGVTLKIEPLESATLVSNLGAAAYQTTLLQWTDSTPDPNDISAYNCKYSDSYQWYSHVEDKEIDAAYLATATETDPAKRAELFWELQELVAARRNIIPLFAQSWTYGYGANVEGIDVTPFNKVNAADIRILAD